MFRLGFFVFFVVAASLPMAAKADSYISAQLLDVQRNGFCDGWYASCEEDNGYRIAYGRQFNSHAGIEFGYIDGGDAVGRFAFARDVASLNALDVAFVGRFATSNAFNFVGRAGVVHGRDKIRYSYTSCYPADNCQTYQYGETLKYSGLTLGLGFEWYNFSFTYDVDTDIFDSGSENSYSSTRVLSRLGIGYQFHF